MSRDQAAELLDRVRQLKSWRPVAKRTGAPRWFGELWTQLCVLTGGDPVDYVAGELRTEAGAAGELYLFTPARIVWGRLEQVDGGVRATALTTPRRCLSRVEAIEGGESAATASAWPGKVHVRLVFPDAEIILPGPDLTELQWEQFHDFLPSILADLGCSRGSHKEVPEHRRPGWAW